jgi:sirohydrochlorin ferrochelatase
MLRVIVFATLLLTAASSFAQPTGPEGILLLAHGGSSDWNQRVTALAATLDASQPTEVAFGMASRPAIQTAVDRLTARGVKSIVAVPLFISSHSSVITSTEYLLGVRREMPGDLRVFAKMNHGAHGAHAAAGHEENDTAVTAVDNTRPVTSPVPIRMTEALNRHRLVGEILVDRAREVSSSPEKEAVIIVAHGPVPEDDNKRWLADMQLVEKESNLGRRVLIVPLLLSYGGIEKGIRQRLEGLNYVMASRALMPDERLLEWVRSAAQ